MFHELLPISKFWQILGRKEGLDLTFLFVSFFKAYELVGPHSAALHFMEPSPEQLVSLCSWPNSGFTPSILSLLIASSAHRSLCPSLPLSIAPSAHHCSLQTPSATKPPLTPNLLCPLPPPHLLTAPPLCPPCPSQPLCQPHRPAPAPLCPPYCLLTCTLTHSLPLLLRKIGTVVVWAISGISVFVFYRLVQKKYPLFKFPSFLIPTNLGNLGQPMHSQWA